MKRIVILVIVIAALSITTTSCKKKPTPLDEPEQFRVSSRYLVIDLFCYQNSHENRDASRVSRHARLKHSQTRTLEHSNTRALVPFSERGRAHSVGQWDYFGTQRFIFLRAFP